jgi:predicted flap endonuclease-1-like 5' DNA nuclease
LSWKIILGKPDRTYIIGKRWIKKNIPKTKRISKPRHKIPELGDIYDIGMRYLPDNPTDQINLWVCMQTGTILKSAPKLKDVPKPKVKASKPKVKVVPKAPKAEKTVKPKPKPEPEVATEVKKIPKKSSFTTITSVSEVKGIGKAVFDKLAAVDVNTIGDLISKHSQEVATLIGRKSDVQIKKWQENAREMLK